MSRMQRINEALTRVNESIFGKEVSWKQDKFRISSDEEDYNYDKFTYVTVDALGARNNNRKDVIKYLEREGLVKLWSDEAYGRVIDRQRFEEYVDSYALIENKGDGTSKVAVFDVLSLAESARDLKTNPFYLFVKISFFDFKEGDDILKDRKVNHYMKDPNPYIIYASLGENLKDLKELTKEVKTYLKSRK